MCGRFSRNKDIQQILKRFRMEILQEQFKDSPSHKASYNIAPSQLAPVIVYEGSKRLRTMKWGLVPSWAKDPAIGQQMINARAETITQKPSFKDLLFSRRCIVPATGFYEWLRDGQRKMPIYFRAKDGESFGFAGLWDRWRPASGQGDELESFTIITTVANETVSPVHNRMPVILSSEDEERWLDPNLKELSEILSMLKPCPPDRLEGYRVTRAVNSPSFNCPECILPE
jgi:putative SOS response-associated peptidase YedK